MSEILTNSNYEIYLFGKGNPSSLLRKFVTALKNKSNTFNYNEIIRKIEPLIVNNNLNSIVNHNKNEQVLSSILVSEEFKQSIEMCKFRSCRGTSNGTVSYNSYHHFYIEKQFFANEKFPMFTFEDKRTFREYGEVSKK